MSVPVLPAGALTNGTEAAHGTIVILDLVRMPCPSYQRSYCPSARSLRQAILSRRALSSQQNERRKGTCASRNEEVKNADRADYSRRRFQPVGRMPGVPPRFTEV